MVEIMLARKRRIKMDTKETIIKRMKSLTKDLEIYYEKKTKLEKKYKYLNQTTPWPKEKSVEPLFFKSELGIKHGIARVNKILCNYSQQACSLNIAILYNDLTYSYVMVSLKQFEECFTPITISEAKRIINNNVDYRLGNIEESFHITGLKREYIEDDYHV